MASRKAKSNAAPAASGVIAPLKNAIVQDEVVCEAQEHVLYAVQLLRSAGGDYEKLAWMLEDALVYFDNGEECSEDDLSRLQILG